MRRPRRASDFAAASCAFFAAASSALILSHRPGDVGGTSWRFVAENVRMAADQFSGKSVGRVGEIECVALLGHASVIDDLQQQIAEFIL